MSAAMSQQQPGVEVMERDTVDAEMVNACVLFLI